jgi:cytochrome oxidase Cu insertion factor (SCO1/SenC/PrrC family)
MDGCGKVEGASVEALSMRRLVLFFAVATVVAIAAAGALVWTWDGGRMQSSAGEALVGGPFALTDQHGQPVTDQDFAERYMLIYFGYTYCPDVCPMSLTNMVAAIDQLPPEQAEKVVPILITIDPERDTVEQLASYAPLFDPRLVALTGSEDEVRAAAKAYRVYFHKAGEGADSKDYLVDHSTFVYLMGPDGKYRTHFGLNASPEEMAEAIRSEIAASS